MPLWPPMACPTIPMTAVIPASSTKTFVLFMTITGYYLLGLLLLSVSLPVMAAAEWQTVINQFQPTAHSAAAERTMIRQAIAILEDIAGTQTPTYLDRGRNPIVDDWPGQMDCIDESTNTKHYLDLLQERGLLHWHRVVERAYRAPYVFDQHWAGQIVELETLDSYVVDSWHLDNGKPPYIQALNDWLRKRRFSRVLVME